MAFRQAGWITVVFAILQILRLASNIVLAHLLAPAIFGVMALINALRSGVELLSDVGVGQNIVVNARGDEPAFYNTAWTIQVMRGAVLTLVGLAVAWPISWFYGEAFLFPLLMICSTIFLLTGFNSPARFLLQRKRDVRRLTMFDLLDQTLNMTAMICFALIMPSALGMTLALVAGSTLTMIISFFQLRGMSLRLKIDREHLASILSFGKWIFASSLIYFAASNFDRLFLPTQIPLALFGVYGISRSMSDLATMFMQRLGTQLIFPAVAQENASFGQRMSRIVKLRSIGLGLVSIALGGGIAISDVFVNLAYDSRYATAAIILPMLLLGAWFSVQSAIAEPVLLGLGQPSRTAGANFIKLALAVVLLPLAFGHGSLILGFGIQALADLPRYFVLISAQHKAGLRFGWHDLGLFVLMLLSAALFRLPLMGLGIVDGFISSTQWFEISALLFNRGN